MNAWTRRIALAALTLIPPCLPAAAQEALSPSPWSAPGPFLANLDPWLDPTPFPDSPDLPVKRDLDPERLAFWEDFLSVAPNRLAPLKEDVARAMAFGSNAEEASALLARAFPDPANPPGVRHYGTSRFAAENPDDPTYLPLPWAYALTVLRRNSGDERRAMGDWYLLAATGVGESAQWRDFLAAAFAADKWLCFGKKWGAWFEERRGEVDRRLASNAAEGVVRLDPHGARGRILYQRLCTPNFDLSPEDGGLSPIAAEFAERGVSNAIACVFLARSERDWAWASRGDSWASGVTPEGWRGFGKHLDASIGYALRARELEPDWPEPYDPLLNAAGAGCYDAENPVELARKALRCEADWTGATSILLHFLRPRWGNGGASAALRALRGVLATRRYDTWMPYSGLDGLETIGADQLCCATAAYATAGHAAPLERDPAVWSAVCAMFEGYLAAADSPVPRSLLLRRYLEWSVRYSDPGPALAAIDRDGVTDFRELDPSPFAELAAAGSGGLPRLRAAAAIDRAAPGVRARHAVACALRDAPGAAKALGEFHAALPVAFPGVPPSAEALAVADDLERRAAVALDWEPEDDWTEIPHPDWEGRIRFGVPSWMRCPPDGQLFVSTNRAAGMSVRWHRRRVAEVAADYAFAGVPGPDLPAAFLRIHATSSHCAGVVFEPSRGILRAYVSDPANPDDRRILAEAEVPAKTADAPFRLRLRVADGILTAWFEGQCVFDALPIPGFPERPDAQPAFGADTHASGIALILSRIRLRVLPKEDEGPDLDLPDREKGETEKSERTSTTEPA